jgi:hypothetical protein
VRRLTALALATLLVVAVASPAGAADSPERRTFVAVLRGGNEIPAVDSDGVGLSVLRLNRAETALSFVLITANLEDIHMAHIHCGPRTANGPVVAFLFGPADPMITKNGVLSHGVITAEDVLDKNATECPAAVTDLDDLVALIRDGNAYVNVHTMDFPAGEIRGQVR